MIMTNMRLMTLWYRIPGQGREQTQTLQHPRLQESSGWESFLSEFSLLDILGPQCWWIGSPQLRDQVGERKNKNKTTLAISVLCSVLAEQTRTTTASSTSQPSTLTGLTWREETSGSTTAWSGPRTTVLLSRFYNTERRTFLWDIFLGQFWKHVVWKNNGKWSRAYNRIYWDQQREQHHLQRLLYAALFQRNLHEVPGGRHQWGGKGQ